MIFQIAQSWSTDKSSIVLQLTQAIKNFFPSLLGSILSLISPPIFIVSWHHWNPYCQASVWWRWHGPFLTWRCQVRDEKRPRFRWDDGIRFEASQSGSCRAIPWEGWCYEPLNKSNSSRIACLWRHDDEFMQKNMNKRKAKLSSTCDCTSYHATFSKPRSWYL